MLFLEGVYVGDGVGGLAFHYNKAPTAELLTELLHIISQRVASFWKDEAFWNVMKTIAISP